MSNKINPIFLGEVKNGKIVLDTEAIRERWRIRLYLLEGNKVELTVQKRRSKRSKKQNNYYWGAVLPLIADQVGMLDEEVHDALRVKFLTIHGDKLDTVRSTATLSTGEFVEYIMNIEMWAQEFLGIERFPDPDEYDPVRML